MHDDGFFDEHVAATYDDDPAISDPKVVNQVVDFLADLAGSGSALEFGIGTGRMSTTMDISLRAYGVST